MQFQELSPQAKETARSLLTTELDLDHVIEDFLNVAGMLGYTLDKSDLEWSVGHCQSDFATFKAFYHGPEKATLPEVQKYAPKAEGLHAIATALDTLQLTAALKFNGRWSAKLCTRGGCLPTVEYGEIVVPGNIAAEPSDGDHLNASDVIEEQSRALAKWLYHQLRDEVEYQSSDEALEGLGYDFDETGAII